MAAEDLKSKKRKSAQEAAPKSKKQKKAADPKPARKQAEDFMSDNEVPAAEPVKKKGSKKSKAAVDANGDKPVETIADAPQTEEKPKKKTKKAKQVADAEGVADIAAEEEAPSTKSKKSKSSKKQKQEAKEVVAEIAAEADQVDEDDQTAALLAGFESDRDESDLEKDDEGLDDEALEKAAPKLSKKQRLALEKAAKREEPGVVYVGRIPHGFFEPQMKRYFNQFGTVKQLRLSRNKKTGASKHYAFVEFASGEVADIVAETMNNYLLFGHILQCKVVPTEQVHPDLFKGSRQRFKVDPRNKKAGLEMERGADRTVWNKRVANENKRRAAKNKKLKDVMDYEYTAPALKAVDDVPKNALENGIAQQLQIEAPAEEAPTKKGKKGAKGKNEPIIEAEETAEPTEPTPEKKNKSKSKKRKSDVTSEVEAQAEPASAEVSTRSKKAKKEVKPEVADEEKEVKRKAKSEQDGTKPKKAKKAKA